MFLDFSGCCILRYGQLRRGEDFFDVTLVSEDGHLLKAHKVLLSASSPNELKVKGLSKDENLANGKNNEENKNPPLEASDKEEERSIINETNESTSFQEKTRAEEDPGFEIIKEVPGNSRGMPRMNMGMMGGLMAPYSMQGMFKDAGLGNMMGSMLGGQGLGAQGNPKKRKCKYFNFQYTSTYKSS